MTKFDPNSGLGSRSNEPINIVNESGLYRDAVVSCGAEILPRLISKGYCSGQDCMMSVLDVERYLVHVLDDLLIEGIESKRI